jgi:hypothetical protein
MTLEVSSRTYAVMAGIVMEEFDLGEGYPKLEPIIPALLCNTYGLCPTKNYSHIRWNYCSSNYGGGVSTAKKSNQASKAEGKADADSRIFIRLDCHFTVFGDQTFALPLYVCNAKEGDSISHMQCYCIRCSPSGTRDAKDAYLSSLSGKTGEE